MPPAPRRRRQLGALVEARGLPRAHRGASRRRPPRVGLQSVHLAARLVRDALDLRGIRSLYLDGSTPVKKRADLVQAWQDGDDPLFLISLKAGGTGLNLTAADTVIHLDPWWNPAVEDQASDRAHRIGQDKPVTVVRLVAQETIEESVLALHGDKRALFQGVLEGTGEAAKLDTQELMALIRGPE
ncbi:MAG: SWF/SNF helicase family protein [Sandaracinus sp.]|nr:SWF/SNF helicase family protein [Sandaracinus sp.]